MNNITWQMQTDWVPLEQMLSIKISGSLAHCTVSLFLFFFKQTDSRIQHLRLVRIKFGKLKSEFKTK